MTLPAPDPAFHWTAEAWGAALRCRPLEAIAQHVFTTRQLALRGGPEEQSAGWRQATAALGRDVRQLMRVKQVHGRGVRVLRKQDVAATDGAAKPEGDALVSDAPGYVLSVQVADCVPILMADPKTGAVAAVHAGWRGTRAGVARAAVHALSRDFGVAPSNLVAAIGPSIGPCCYAVGGNVLEAFRSAGASDSDLRRWFLRQDRDVLRLDLWAANVAQLLDEGVSRERVHLCGLCTQTHAGVFESYRVDGERAGRMAALIAVP